MGLTFFFFFSWKKTRLTFVLVGVDRFMDLIWALSLTTFEKYFLKSQFKNEKYPGLAFIHNFLFFVYMKMFIHWVSVAFDSSHQNQLMETQNLLFSCISFFS